jgi:hypothetical protein
MVFRLVETRRQAELGDTSYIKCSKVRILPSHARNTEGESESRHGCLETELELELIQTQMTQKPVLWAEVYARALGESQYVK